MTRRTYAFHAEPDPQENEVNEDLFFLATGEVERLNKDLRNASRSLSANEARYLVSAYYSVQDLRKRFFNQERAMSKAEPPEPHDMVSYMAKQMHRMEKQIQISLDVYSHNHPVGAWLRANKGIGPVIAAGLLSHIDIHKAPTVGHIWRYAGLDPTMKWYGKGINDIIRAARQAEPDDWSALVWLSKSLRMRVGSMLVNAGMIEEEALMGPQEAMAYVYGVRKEKIALLAEFHSDNILKEGLGEGPELVKAYQDIYGHMVKKIRWEDLAKTLAKRPWNSELKTLCWKIGESFKKVSTGEKPSPYGVLYRERKAREIARNQNGEYAETALEIIRVKKISKTTDAYHWYSGEWVNSPKFNPELAAAVELRKDRDGLSADDALKAELAQTPRMLRPMLPPAHIDARASRYAVKIFISHLHDTMYKRVLGRNPPNPYPIAHLGHVHMIHPFIRDEDFPTADEIVAAE